MREQKIGWEWVNQELKKHLRVIKAKIILTLKQKIVNTIYPIPKGIFQINN